MATDHEDDLKDEKNPRPLDEDDIALLKTYVCLKSPLFLLLLQNPNFLFSSPLSRSPYFYHASMFSHSSFLQTQLLTFIMQGLGPYSTSIKKVEKEIKDMAKKVNDLCGT